MPKNIVICCDGTANEFADANTNVVKLYYTLDQDRANQVTFYHPGIGTMEPAGALTTFSRKLTKIAGMAVGYALADDIRDAYVFLMRNYEEGDSVYLFGFSRGAFTARVVAALLYMYGVIRLGNEPLVPYAIRMLTGIDRADKANDKEAKEHYFALAKKFKQTLSWTMTCKPKFVGVWDTVSSVGWVENPLKVPFETSNPDIEIGRHAVSIDEHRSFFRSHLWRPSANPLYAGPKDLKQVWFAGVHCDVGGGYPEPESGLSKYPLEWMLEEARFAGLRVNDEKQEEVLGRKSKDYAPADPDASMHKSLAKWWNIAEFVPKPHYDYTTQKTHRRMNLYRHRTLPKESMVHESAYLRKQYKMIPEDAIPVKTVRAPR
jgi:uncharacterized protein (DUF2235 family)